MAETCFSANWIFVGMALAGFVGFMFGLTFGAVRCTTGEKEKE